MLKHSRQNYIVSKKKDVKLVLTTIPQTTNLRGIYKHKNYHALKLISPTSRCYYTNNTKIFYTKQQK